MQHRRRDARVLHEQTDRVLAHRDTDRRRDRLATGRDRETVRVGLRVDVRRLIARTPCGSHRAGPSREHPPRTRRRASRSSELLSPHGANGVDVGRAAQLGNTVATVESTPAEAGPTSKPTEAQPSADAEATSATARVNRRERRERASMAMGDHSCALCHDGTPGSPLAPPRRGDQMEAGGSTRHPVRGYLREQESYRPPVVATLSGQLVTLVTLRGQLTGRTIARPSR